MSHPSLFTRHSMLIVVATAFLAAIVFESDFNWAVLSSTAEARSQVDSFLSVAQEIDSLFVDLIGDQASSSNQAATREAIKANLIAQNTRLDLIHDRLPAAAKGLLSDYAGLLVELDGLLKYDAAMDEVTAAMLKLVSMRSELSQALGR